MRAPSLLLALIPTLLVAFESTAWGTQQCTDVDTFNALAAAEDTTAKTISVEFDVTGVNPADYPDGKGWLAEFAYTKCWNVDNNDYGALASLKVYGASSVDGGTHVSGSIKDEYGVCCVSPPGGCPDNWASGDFQQTIFSDPAQICHIKIGVDASAVSYSIQCDGGQVFSGTGDNTAIGLTPDKVSLLKSANGGHPMAASVVASNVQVCFELAPSSSTAQQLLAVEDATVSAAMPDTVVTPDTDLSLGPDDGNILMKFVVPSTAGLVTSAKLRVTASTVASADGDGGDLFFVADNNWSEKTVTWNTAPATVPPSLGQVLGVVAGGTYTVDVSSKVTGPGTYSFELAALTNGSSNGAHFLSKEASTTSGPRLVIESDPDASVPPSGGGSGAAGGDAGPGAGGAWGTGAALGVGGSGGNPIQGGTDAGGDGGCGCAVPRPMRKTAAFIGLAALALTMLRRRGRR